MNLCVQAKDFEAVEKETEVTVITTKMYRSASASVSVTYCWRDSIHMLLYFSLTVHLQQHEQYMLSDSCLLVLFCEHEGVREPDWLVEFVGEWERREWDGSRCMCVCVLLCSTGCIQCFILCVAIWWLDLLTFMCSIKLFNVQSKNKCQYLWYGWIKHVLWTYPDFCVQRTPPPKQKGTQRRRFGGSTK